MVPTAIALCLTTSLPIPAVFRNEDSGHIAVAGGTTEVGCATGTHVHRGGRGIVEVRDKE
jgi:hypothetical protein